MKTLIITAALLFGVSFNASAAIQVHAQEQAHQTSEDFVEHALIEVQELINADVNTEERLSAFMAFVDDTLDVPYFVEKLFYRQEDKWQNATPDDKAQAVHLMKEYIAGLYINNFQTARNGRVVVTGVQALPGDQSLVEVKIELLNSVDFVVAFKAVKHNGAFKIRDVVFDDISLLHNLRGSYRRTIKSGGVGGLITRLQEQITDITA
jgi:ABC-type transporter MlaC component